MGDAWEQHADSWISWARTSPHDGFAAGTWPQLRALVPFPTGLAVEIGSGEGRVGRELLRLGPQVIGVERSATLVQAARQAEPPLNVVHADAAAVPIANGVASLVVACMSLQDIDDLASAVREAARILHIGGQFCVAIVHPFSSAEDRASWDSDVAMFSEPYLEERRVEDHVERDGQSMTFVSQHRPLGMYIAAFADAGFMLTSMHESGNRPIPGLLVARMEKVR